MPLQLIKTLLTEPRDDIDPEIAPEVLIAESNHRIANNLAMIAALIRLQAGELADACAPLTADEVRVLLNQVSGRIDTVGRLHRLLAEAVRGQIPDFGSYLRDIALAVVTSLSPEPDSPRLKAEVRGCPLRAGQALSVGFIVGELVTNSVKYAHPAGVSGEIRLRCLGASDGATIVEVADDGIGLPEGFDPNHEGGLGLRLVRSLALQLKADLAFEQSGLGLTTRLSIPPSRLVEAA
jgi:two-component sensor histidine kinase